MNIDIRLSLEFFDHPKTKKLRKRLGVEGVLALLKLWAWTAGNRPGGVLTGLDAEAVELAADWGGEEGAFVPELLALRLLDEDDGVFAVHDWEDHQSYACKSEERSSKARKAAEARWGRKQETPGNTGDDADPLLGDALSNAQLMRGDATSMLAHVASNAPRSRNQDPEAKINTPPTQEYFNNPNTRARALNTSGGEGGGAEPVASAASGTSAVPAASVWTGEAGEVGETGEPAGTDVPPSGLSGLSRDGPARTDAPSKGTPEWAAFLSCWDVYPVRQGQEDAWREWMRLKRNGTLEAAFVIREAILSMCAEDSRWKRGKVPKFARWLNGKGWNDTPFVEPGDADAVRGGPALPGGGRNGEPAAPTEYQRQRQSSRKLAAVLLAGRLAADGGNTETTTGGVYEATAFATAGGTLPAVRTGTIARGAGPAHGHLGRGA